jgi:hypothetical protein
MTVEQAADTVVCPKTDGQAKNEADADPNRIGLMGSQHVVQKGVCIRM